jgi:hypothetical protein
MQLAQTIETLLHWQPKASFHISVISSLIFKLLSDIIFISNMNGAPRPVSNQNK